MMNCFESNHGKRNSRPNPRPAVFLWLMFFVSLSLVQTPALAAPKGSEFVLGDLRIPPPTGYVNDFAGILSSREAAELEQLCRRIDGKTGAQLAIAIIPSLAGETADDVRTRLFESWQMGRKDDHRGLLILHAIAERRVEVEVGYDLEGIIPDGVAGQILDEALVPRFRDGDYFGGYRNGLAALYKRISSDDAARGGQDAYTGRSGGRRGGKRGFPWGGLLMAPIFVYLLIKHPRLLLLLLLSGMGGGRSRGGNGGGFGGGFGGFGGGMSGGGGAGRSY
jgi:uncharacterized protein